MRGLGDMTPRMILITDAIDAIGWTNFMHGRIPLALKHHQQHHYTLAATRLSGDDWVRAFIRRILDIAHGQWLFQNLTLHNAFAGYLLAKKQEHLTLAITRLADSDPNNIPPESRFLLEIDPLSLANSPVDQKQYWVAAVSAALIAGRQRLYPRSPIGRHRPVPLIL